VVRKERAVGVVPQVPTVYEVLEEMAITVQHTLMDSPTPFCAFNGGSDVFVDVRACLPYRLKLLMRFQAFFKRALQG
jgi:hypothetical protein